MHIDADAVPPSAEIRRLGDMPEQVRTRLRETPERGDDRLRRSRELLASLPGPLAVAILDGPLAPGVLAEVRIGAPPPFPRYMVAPKARFDDEVLDRAQGIAMGYAIHHPDDDGPVSITLYDDARFVRVSESLGRFEGVQEFRVCYRDRSLRSSEILREASAAEPIELPGIGVARVVRLGRRD